MGDGITLARPNLGQLLKSFAWPLKPTHDEQVAEVVAQAHDLVRNIASIINDLIAAAIEKRTVAEFIAVRDDLFPQYATAVRALGDLAQIVIKKPTIERLNNEWFSELEADFRELGPPTFGSDMTERGLFTVWTLRKIQDLAEQLSSSSAAQGENSNDVEKARNYATMSLWTRFHLDCLIKCMRERRAVHPDIIEPIRDGLRAAVNTYADIREWIEARNPQAEPELTGVEWTQEDELLLEDSMIDFDETSLQSS